MNPFIQIDAKEVLLMLQTLQQRTGDLSPTMKAIAGIMADSVEENFAKQGRPRWPDLADSTKAQRAKKGHWPGSILQVSGGLVSSVSQQSDKTSATVGTNKPYAAIHQFGGMAGRGRKVRIPARPFLFIGNEEMQEIRDLVAFYLAR